MTTLYGISNCDTVKKAQRWLDAQGIEFTFHDFRKDGLDKTQLEQWSRELGWESLVNKRSTTWRQLEDDVKNTLDAASAVEVMLANPTLIKRPVLDLGESRKLGFKDSDYASYF